MREAYTRLAGVLFRHRLAVLLLWLLTLLAAIPNARRAPQLLSAGSGQLAGTASSQVEATLAREFASPFAQSFAVTFYSASARHDEPAFWDAIAILEEKLLACPGVARVIVPGGNLGAQFRSADGHSFAVLVGLRASTTAEAEKLVPVVRNCVRTALSTGALPDWEIHVTGRAAMIYDLNLYNAADSQRAELRALPLTLLVLLFVFGSLVSAALPLALGVASTLLALSLVPALVPFAPLNILYQNVVTLLGLALGIDYSLFMVSRYREERATGRDRPTALAETMATTGVAVTYSGLTVLIGLGGLLLTPLFELRSIGFGGIAVVAMSLLLSLTLLPALLAVFDHWLGSPKKLAAALRLSGSRRRWERWTTLVLHRPAAALLLGLAVLLTLALPLLSIRPGFPDKPWLPPAMESAQGFATLQRMGVAQELMPIQLLARATDGGPVLPDHLDAFFTLSEKIKRDPRVARVFGPVDLGTALPDFKLRELYANLDQTLAEHPEIGALVLSRHRDYALLQVSLRDGTSYEESLACSRDLAALSVPGLTLQAGGHWPSCNDFDSVLLAAHPIVFGTVIAATFLVLLVAFRSVLVPVKALMLNTLSVCAAFGAIVAVFQWGWGAGWLGLDGPTGAIPLTIPLIVFCLTFGLSMDYEVFILARVREEFLRDRHGDGSVRRGLIATGALISGAAAIMAVVFGAFAFAGVVIVKMLGFGLAVAVIVDALVVRAMMVPAAMKLAGRWNWWPGLRDPAP